MEAEKLFAEVFPDSSKLDASQLEKHYSVSRQMHFFHATSDCHTVPYLQGWFIHWTKYNGPKGYNWTAALTSSFFIRPHWFGKAYAMALDDIQAASICDCEES